MFSKNIFGKRHFMLIKPNHKINEIIDSLPSVYDKQTSDYNNEIHTTHVTARCLRQSYFRITMPKPTTSYEAAMFIVGEAQHVVLQKLLGPLLKAEPERKTLIDLKNKNYTGIVCRIDMLLPDAKDAKPLATNGEVIEIKTNRSFKRAIKSYYLDQIKCYLVARSRELGIPQRKAVLIIIWQNAAREIADENLSGFTVSDDEDIKSKTRQAARQIEAYNVWLSQKELTQAMQEIDSNFFALTNALDAKKPNMLDAVKQNDVLRKTICHYCKYKTECDQADKPELRRFGQDGRINARRKKE